MFFRSASLAAIPAPAVLTAVAVAVDVAAAPSALSPSASPSACDAPPLALLSLLPLLLTKLVSVPVPAPSLESSFGRAADFLMPWPAQGWGPAMPGEGFGRLVSLAGPRPSIGYSFSPPILGMLLLCVLLFAADFAAAVAVEVDVGVFGFILLVARLLILARVVSALLLADGDEEEEARIGGGGGGGAMAP